MSSGILVASFVTTGTTPVVGTGHRPPMIREAALPFVDDRWSPPVYDRIGVGDTLQPGVRASGSSRL